MAADRYGERKYHVQFFKFHSASPLSVKTRVRCLPHIQQPTLPASSNSSSSGIEAQQRGVSSSSSSRAYCFLEVSVDNATPLPLVLHAVNLLTPAGLTPKQLTSHMWQQQQEQGLGQQQQLQQDLLIAVQHQSHTLQQQQAGTKHMAAARGKQVADGVNDTSLQPDVDDDTSSSADAHAFAFSAAVAGGLQPSQQSAETAVGLQQQQQFGSQAAELGPLLAGQPSLVVLPPGGGSYNYLWQVEQQQLSSTSSSNDATAAAGPNSSRGSSSSAFLGRLELHWSTVDGKTGRLLTQPLSRPISTAAGKDVLMQLTQLLPAAAEVHAQQQQPFLDHLEVGVPVRAVFSITAAALQQQQNAVGPLLVLYTELSPSGPSAAAAVSNSSSSGRVSDSSSNGQQQQQQGPAAASNQQRRPGSSGSSSDSSRVHPAVAVQGKRSVRLLRLSAGDAVTVDFQLLPLRRGWVRLPTFVVVSEADGRLLDSVHDVQVLVM